MTEEYKKPEETYTKREPRYIKGKCTFISQECLCTDDSTCPMRINRPDSLYSYQERIETLDGCKYRGAKLTVVQYNEGWKWVEFEIKKGTEVEKKDNNSAPVPPAF